MTKQKKINMLSFAKFQAILLALIGLFAGIFYSVGGALYDALTIGLNFGTALAFLALIGMPITFALFGYVLGLFEAFLYNVFAKWFSGVDLNFYH